MLKHLTVGNVEAMYLEMLLGPIVSKRTILAQPIAASKRADQYELRITTSR